MNSMKLSAACCLLAMALSVPAQEAKPGPVWSGLTEANYYSGPKISASDLAGKVVMVDCWGYQCGPCIRYLPHMETLWKKYRTKPFVLIGSHCQGRQPEEVAALVKANKLTYPVYDFVNIQNPPDGGNTLPFMYVVDHRGKVVYAGRDIKEAEKAIAKAIGKIGQPPSLCGNVALKKYKMLEAQLVLGKPVKPILTRLSDDIKRCTIPSATASMREQAEEAQQLLDAVQTVKNEVKGEIESLTESNPPEALKLVRAFLVSFPEDGTEYRQALPSLMEKARTFGKAPMK